MDSYLVWGMGLVAASLVLLLLDVLLPSGGALSLAAGLSLIAGIVCLFLYDRQGDTYWGPSTLLGSLSLGPLIVIGMIKMWPHTPVGRRIIGVPTEEEAARKAGEEEAERRRWLAMVGKEGVVLTDLRPLGVVEIDGKRYDAISETRFVPSGQRVRVSVVEGAQIKVRPLA